MKFIKRWLAKMAINQILKQIENYVMKKSWKTTLAGWITLIVAVLLAGLSVIDGDPTTKPDTTQIFHALELVGISIPIWLMGIFSRDKDVSSEEQKE